MAIFFGAVSGGEALGVDGTNIYLRTNASFTVNNQRRPSTNGGFYRILAWR
jgi:hypothetical protein